MDCLFETGNLLHRTAPVSGAKIYNPLVWFLIPCLYVNVIHQSDIRSSEYYYERNSEKVCIEFYLKYLSTKTQFDFTENIHRIFGIILNC